MTRERLILGLLFGSTFAVRALHADQPIVENYVGRQIPTAMVARNLEKGSGFLFPQLDTGPFPNLFLVEPPLYAQLVACVRPVIGFDLESTGRLVSAAATTLAAWGLFGLARRREGSTVALLALASFCCLPVMIRFGRAFQPDALMLGCVLAGLRGWDEYEAGGNWRWLAFGGFVLAIGLALKVTTAWALIPFVLLVRRWSIGPRLAASAAMLVPALLWYLHAWKQLGGLKTGSLASFDNANLWARSLSPVVWLRFSTWANLGIGLAYRSFTPIGFVLAAWGWLAAGKVDRFWLGWGAGCVLSIVGLASKWHHAYYWMVVAPLAAVGAARGLASAWRVARPLVPVLGSIFLAMAAFQSAPTWRTPTEWRGLVEAGKLVASLSTEEERVIAPEALLYYANRRGFRLEFEPEAARRSSGEWGYALPDPERPLALTEFFWSVHSSWFSELRTNARLTRFHQISADHVLVADVGPSATDSRRQAWRDEIRSRPRIKILADRPDMIIAELR